MNETRPSDQSNPESLHRAGAALVKMFAASDFKAACAAEERERDRFHQEQMAREQKAAAMVQTIALFQARPKD